jgi:hypothetical protein
MNAAHVQVDADGNGKNIDSASLVSPEATTLPYIVKSLALAMLKFTDRLQM